MKKVISEADIADYRNLMLTLIEERDPDRKAAIALSGGTDSTTLLFAMLSSGRKPRCYTFYVEGTISEDLIASRNLAKSFDLELIEVMIPYDHDKLVADIRQLVPAIVGPKLKKTIVQCLHPWLYLVPAMKERGDTTVLCGLGGDDHFCTQRKVAVFLHKNGEEALLKEGWRKCYSLDVNFSGGNIHHFCAARGVTLSDIYNDDRMTAWFTQFTSEALHRTGSGKWRTKAASVRAFIDFYSKGAFFREPDRYQLGSNLKGYHESLMTTAFNKNGSKDVLPIYKAIINNEV